MKLWSDRRTFRTGARRPKIQERAMARSTAVAEREERYRAITAVAMEVPLLETSSEEDESSAIAQNKARTVDACFATKRRRGTISVVTCCVAPALNRTKNQQQEALS